MKNNKKEDQPSFFKELGSFMKPYNNKYTLSVILSILSVTFSILSFVFVSFIIRDLFSINIKWENLLLYLVLAIISKILNAIFLHTSTLIAHKAAYLTLKDIRLGLTEKMMKLPLGYFETKGSGRLKTLLVDHVESMEKTLAHMIPELTSNILVPLCLIGWMFFIDWRLSLIMLTWIILGFMVTSGMMKNYNTKFSGQIKCQKEMTQAVVEMVNGIEVIKNFGRSDDIYDKFKEKVTNHASYNVNWQKETQVYSALGMAIAPFSLFPVLIFGLIFYKAGSITPSSLLMMAILTFAIFGPLMQSSLYFDQLAGLGTNAKEIKDVLDYQELVRGEESQTTSLDIKFRDVSFGYDDKQVLNNINLDIKSGEMFALVGESGSGKSTIAKLLAGYFDVKCGDILIGDKNIKEYSQEYLNKLISYVDQDTFLFNKSIKDNIRLGKQDATDEEIIEASKKAGCHEFISKLKNGYDTICGEMGENLSGGEKQRIALVRAMIKNSPIMILDEATASTDPENESEIQESILACCKSKTLIVVAHRLYTIKCADKIALIKNGRVEKVGSHEELLNNETYHNLWISSEGENDD